MEIQLGKTDESHIVRTIEYWDIERKRYPQYDHTAVIVAEEITARFLNVITRIEPRLTRSDTVEQKIESAGLDVMDYDNRWGRYRIRLAKGDVKKHAAVLRELFEAAYKDAAKGEG